MDTVVAASWPSPLRRRSLVSWTDSICLRSWLFNYRTLEWTESPVGYLAHPVISVTMHWRIDKTVVVQAPHQDTHEITSWRTNRDCCWCQSNAQSREMPPGREAFRSRPYDVSRKPSDHPNSAARYIFVHCRFPPLPPACAIPRTRLRVLADASAKQLVSDYDCRDARLECSQYIAINQHLNEIKDLGEQTKIDNKIYYLVLLFFLLFFFLNGFNHWGKRFYFHFF